VQRSWPPMPGASPDILRPPCTPHRTGAGPAAAHRGWLHRAGCSSSKGTQSFAKACTRTATSSPAQVGHIAPAVPFSVQAQHIAAISRYYLSHPPAVRFVVRAAEPSAGGARDGELLELEAQQAALVRVPPPVASAVRIARRLCAGRAATLVADALWASHHRVARFTGSCRRSQIHVGLSLAAKKSWRRCEPRGDRAARTLR
jgi:hypothetical protein